TPRLSGEASAQSATDKSSVLLQQVADEVWQRKLKSPVVRLDQGLTNCRADLRRTQKVMPLSRVTCSGNWKRSTSRNSVTRNR
ncbi:MAG: hypothetical protein ACRD63_10270, partial [Pyrinomonadaceae bacterium]